MTKTRRGSARSAKSPSPRGVTSGTAARRAGRRRGADAINPQRRWWWCRRAVPAGPSPFTNARPVGPEPSAPSTVIESIGRHAANLFRDGDTLQFGLGSVLPEVARALHGHRRLRVLSGMVSPWLQTLWESGSLDRDAQIVTGVVFGDASFYDYVGRLDRVRLEDVRSTHAVHSISQIPRFVAVNSAVEVDLFGQMNSERSDGSLQAGAGGLPAFAHAAQIAPQGRLLICLPATARGGKLSRIVSSLDSNSLCTVPRHQADAIVTEFGVAELRGLPVERRAEALIAIAHPDHRERLSAAWDEMGKRL